MFIRKIAGIWLVGLWNVSIYPFPYRRSGQFIRLSIKVKTQDFWEDGRETIDRGREKLVKFGKLSVNFRKLSGKTWNDRLLRFYQSFPSIYIQHKLSRACSEYFSQAINKLLINWLDCLYEKYKSLSPSHRPPCGRSIHQDLGLYIFPYRQSNQLLRRYYCLTACSYAKCCNLIGWILELGPSTHFRIDGLDHSYGFRSKLKHRTFGKMVEKLSTEVVKC